MTNRFEKKSKLTLFIVLAVSILLLLIGFEKLLGMSLGYSESETRYIRLRENSPHLDLKLTPTDAELALTENLENKAFSFATDNNGFLLPSLVHDNAEFTLAFIGGSTTESMYVDSEKRFHYLIGKALSNDKRKINTLNAGVSGNDSLNSINAYLNKIVPIKPDFAILMHNINDISTLLHEGSYWNNNDHRSPIIYKDKSIKAFLKSSFPNSFELLYVIKTKFSGPSDEFANVRHKTKSINEQQIYRLFEENLNLFVSISKTKGITPVLMTQASRFTEKPDLVVKNKFKRLESLGINYTRFRTLYDGMNDRVRKVAADSNVQLIDLAKNIPPSKEYIVDTVHFNGKGSELVAKLIVEQIEPIISAMPVKQ